MTIRYNGGNLIMAYRDRIRIAVHISDIHIGAPGISGEEFKYQLYERFIKPLETMAIIDLITFNGDISHESLPFNSKFSEVYIWLFTTIIEIANKHRASIIIVKGTLSHEFNQLNNLKVFKTNDVYIVEEPTVLYIKGLKIYCIPDIHIKNSDEEKALYQYKDGEFDIIVGHGHVTETQFITQDGEYSINKNIIYNTKQLLRMCKGYIVFGHIHTYMQIKERLFYTGSFLRYIHGEELSKGFLVAAYIPENNKFIMERVINDLAFNFNEYEIKHTKFDDLSAEDIVKKVEKFISAYSVDRLCLTISYVNTDINIAKINILRKYFDKNKIVNKLKFKALSKKESDLLIQQEEATIDHKDKKYLIDKSLRFEEKLQRFIKEEYGVELPLEKIETVLYTDNLLLRGG